jgi:hypothetical protein
MLPHSRTRYTTTLAVFGFWLMSNDIAAAGTSSEAPVAGTIINESNEARFQTYLTPSTSWIVRNGAKLRVGPYRESSLPRATAKATAQYAANVKLTPSLGLENYVAGIPFAMVDLADPHAAAKLMLNVERANAVDDMAIQGIECDTGTIARDGDQGSAGKHYLLDHYRLLSFSGRLFHDPKPELQPNSDSVRSKEAAYPVIEPFDQKGNGMVAFRYLATDKPIDTWLYLPQLRRIRRVSTSQRSEAQFGQDIDMDSFGGFAGAVTSFKWRLFGEKTMLGPFRADAIPARWSAAPAEFLPDAAWEPRRVWVIEGEAAISEYAYSKRVIYVDRETYRILASDLYDRAGELWKSWIGSFLFDGVPDGGSVLVLATMIDIRAGKRTSCSIPGGTMGAYYVNEGETCEESYVMYAGIAGRRPESCQPRNHTGPGDPDRLPMRP